MFDPRKIRGLILDLDGVLWLDTQAIGDLPQIFRRIEALGLKVVLATNNATRTVQQHLAKVASFGVRLEPWQVVNSSQAAASYRKAAEQGYSRAQSTLAIYYAIGDVVPKDTVLAYAWLNLSAAQGEDSAKELRDLIEKELTSAQRAEGQSLATNWKKGELL